MINIMIEAIITIMIILDINQTITKMMIILDIRVIKMMMIIINQTITKMMITILDINHIQTHIRNLTEALYKNIIKNHITDSIFLNLII